MTGRSVRPTRLPLETLRAVSLVDADVMREQLSRLSLEFVSQLSALRQRLRGHELHAALARLRDEHTAAQQATLDRCRMRRISKLRFQPLSPKQH